VIVIFLVSASRCG